MTILSKLKALLGFGRSRRDGRGIEVPVEREPATETERAVEESPPPTDRGEPEDAIDARGAAEPVQSIDGIGPAYAERLAEAGIETVGELAAADAADLAERTGLGEARIDDWIDRTKAS